VLPIRLNDFTLNELPMCAKSKHDNVDPNFAMPYTLNPLPHRLKRFKLNDEPNVKKSSIENDEPIFTQP
jgi:hypothetical protein